MGREADDHYRHTVLDDDFGIAREPVVTGMGNLIDGEGRGGQRRVGAVIVGKRGGDVGEPLVKLGVGACVQGRHGTDDAGLALRDNQGRARDDEHRCGDYRRT